MRGARVGVDLGRAGVKLVACDARGAARGAEQPVDPSLSGEARRAALVQALADAARELGLRAGAELHVAVPRAQGIVKRLELPSAPDAELDAMVRLQAAKELPFPLSDTVIAWAREGAGAQGGERVTFAAVRRETLDELRGVVEAAGFRAGSLEVSTKAAARTLVLEGPAQEAAPGSAQAPGHEVLLVEVGHATSDVIVTRGGRLVYTRSASVGSGRAGEGEAWLARLEQEVMRSLVAARTRTGGEAGAPAEGTPRGGPPDALLLAGGGSGLDALRGVLAARLGREPQILRGLPDGDPERAARFVVARGLADPRPTPGIPRLDLAHRAQARAARGTRQRMAVGAGLALAALVALGVSVQQAFAAAEAEVSELEALRADLEPAVQRVRQARAELDQARAWTARKGLELELLLAVAAALPDPERVYMTQLRWVEDRPLRLAGRAKDWGAAAALFSRLEADPRFARATFDAIRRPREPQAIGVEFSGQADPAEARP